MAPEADMMPRGRVTQDNFGVTAKQQRRDWVMTRLPAKLFRDFKANGPMYTVSATCSAPSLDVQPCCQRVCVRLM